MNCLHLVRLSKLIEVFPHNRTSVITSNLNQDLSLLCSVIYLYALSFWKQVDHLEPPYGQSSMLTAVAGHTQTSAQSAQDTEQQRPPLQISVTLITKSDYYNCFLLTLLDGWLSKEHLAPTISK